ncbi:hypothetical protein SEA_YOKURT_74 [Mycobacterium phage Yokurt]|uniref:Uncharacterized protein n=8 Tax=Gladiatorvirus TaxID=2948726 RepID=G1BMK9_9CAUD|nr:hypothetical protein FGG54_gp36 [Mycobacterium phage Gladiator]AEJ95063.1 hypothetical protein GLADIATOR_72 [Mycobacterium phage Gladiator]QAY14240.1 hypothetical protein SEA_HEXAMO_74 [Mycobacterium phage Hexamo]QGZ13583.1 hypothetical protein SEA_YOKURT_74 [Mycobacterium phage Yokurt]UQS94644.1 hypothetical protein SEA_RIFTER_75 [Mycobacterium Phage Rifter]
MTPTVGVNGRKAPSMGRHSAPRTNKAKLAVGGIIAGAAISSAGLSLAAPAAAQPSSSVSCSPCVQQQDFIKETVDKWNKFPGELHDKWVKFPGELADKWNKFPSELADKWKNFPNELKKKWGIKSDTPKAPSEGSSEE